MRKIQRSAFRPNNTIAKIAYRLENNRLAAQRSRQRKKIFAENLDRKVMALTRAREELVEKNQKLLLDRKRRQKRLEIARQNQMQLTQNVWASFLACKVATEELKRCIKRSRGTETCKSVPDLFQNERSLDVLGKHFMNSLETSKEGATTATKSSCVSSTDDMPLLTSGCRHEDAKLPFFKQMDNDLENWMHFEGAISF